MRRGVGVNEFRKLVDEQRSIAVITTRSPVGMAVTSEDDWTLSVTKWPHSGARSSAIPRRKRAN